MDTLFGHFELKYMEKIFYPSVNRLDKVTTKKRLYGLNIPMRSQKGLREYCVKVSALELSRNYFWRNLSEL